MNSKGNVTENTKRDEGVMRRLVHLDEKVLQPKDKIGSGLFASSSETTPVGEAIAPAAPVKRIIGRPKVYDLNGNLLADEENLVVLIGREYLAQMLAGTRGENGNDYTDYRIAYFGVGDGGSTTPPVCPPTTVGPYDDDVDLENRIKIANSVPPANYLIDEDYVDDGNLKRITKDGEITVVSEEHTINTDHGGQIVVDRYTAVRYTMYLQPNEPLVKPFRFNEAGLFAVKYVYDAGSGTNIPTDDYILFARFTTLDKYLETADGIMIEWYILV